MIIAAVVSVLLHLGFIVFVDSAPWMWEEPEPKPVKISVSLKPRTPPPPPPTVPEPPPPQPEKTAPPLAPKPLPVAEDPEPVVARAPEPATRTRTLVRQPGIPFTSPSSNASAVDVTPQVYRPPSDPVPLETNPRPQYPRKAKRFGWEGTVLLIVEVLPDGSSGKIEIKQSSGYNDLDRSALAAMRQWKFTPAQEEGVAVVKKVEIPIIFDMN